MEDQQNPAASNPLENFFNISFDATTRSQVRQAALWAKVCTLCAFIGYGIVLIVAIFGRRANPLESEEGQRLEGFVRASRIATAMVSIVVGGIINYFLYRFAVATARGMISMDNGKANEGFNNLRIYFKICGVLLIIALGLGALGILVLIANLAGR